MESSNLNDCVMGNNINKREILESGNNKYFLINEVFYSDYTSTYTGKKIQIYQDKINEENKTPLLIKFISRDFLKKNIFSELELKDDRLEKLFESLKNEFPKYQNLKHEGLQNLIDFIVNEKGVYFILEFFNFTLNDYIKMNIDQIKNTKTSIELHLTGFRELITDFFSCVNYIHEKGLYFGSLINPNDIYLKASKNSESKKKYFIKITHPFLSYIFTLLELKSNLMENKFPVNFPPDIYQIVKKRKTDNFESLNSILSSLDTSFDIWTSGILLYQMINDKIPFNYDSLDNIDKSNNIDNYYYELFPWKISYELLVLITCCLRYNKNDRIQKFYLNQIINEIKKGNENQNKLYHDLKIRLDVMTKEKYPARFNLFESNQAEKYKKKDI